jgi:hypothetical protein
MRSAQSTLAVMSLIAAGLAGLVTALRPFDHGVWLIAYLFLVGFAAQYLLGRWQASLIAVRGVGKAPLGLQATLWSAGVILVPAGVLLEARAMVVIGAIVLLAALASFAYSASATRPRRGRDSIGPWAAQVALIAFMAISAVVGTALAWDTPWLSPA